MQRADQGRDLMTNPGGAVIAPGAGVVIRNGYDPNGFGTSYPIVRFTTGPYAGKDIYIGHTMSMLKPGDTFQAGQILSHTGTTGNEPWNGNATRAGWAEIGYAPGGSPGRFGQPTPFGSTAPVAATPTSATSSGITAEQINRYLSRQGSPLAGLGNVFVSAGKRYGVDPALLVAISGAESSLGKNDFRPNNPFGYMGGGFSTLGQGINTVAGDLGRNYDLSTLASIQSRYAPIGAGNDPSGLNANWQGNVGRYYRALTGRQYGGDAPVSASAPASASAGSSTMPSAPPTVTLADLYPTATPSISSGSPPRTTLGTGAAAVPSVSQQIVNMVQTALNARPASPNVKADTARARADVNYEVAQYENQQRLLEQQAAQRAGAIQAAANAGAHFLAGLNLGGQIGDEARQAAALQGTLASGFTGDLRDTAAQDAQRVQDNLAAIGAPGTAPNNSAAVANAIYARGGQIPADLIGGPNTVADLVARANSAPAEIIGGGQQAALAARSAGAQQAATLAPNIAAAEAKFPSLLGQYETADTTASAKARQDAIANAFKAAGLDLKLNPAAKPDQYHFSTVPGVGVYATDLATGKTQPVISISGGGTSSKPFHFSVPGQGEYQYDPSTRTTTQIGPSPKSLAKPSSSAPHTKTVNGVTYQWNGAAWVQSPGLPAAAAKPPGSSAPHTKTVNGVTYQWNGSSWQPAKGIPKSTGTSGGPYKPPSSVISGGRSLANSLHGNATAVSDKLFANSKTTGTSRPQTAARPWDEALRRMEAYLRAVNVPEKYVTDTAARFLISAGYPDPGAIVTGPSGAAVYPGSAGGG
jgi:hypothetical protein